MAADNRFLGVKRGAPLNVHAVVHSTGSAGTAVDVEVRLQLNDGSTATGLLRKDVLLALEVLMDFVAAGGENGNGADLPAL